MHRLPAADQARALLRRISLSICGLYGWNYISQHLQSYACYEDLEGMRAPVASLAYFRLNFFKIRESETGEGASVWAYPRPI